MSSPVRDKDFDLVSTLYHASQGAELSHKYAADAEANSDKEGHEFFVKAAKEYGDLADEARKLLKQRL